MRKQNVIALFFSLNRCLEALGAGVTHNHCALDLVFHETADTSAGFKPAEPQPTVATSRNASLNGLPAKLKTLILHSAPNIPALQALVRSSPLYHKVYLDKRKVILSAVLLRDIGTEILPDALAVYKTSQIELDESGRRKDSVQSFISQYKAERGSASLTTCNSLDIRTLGSLSCLQSVVAKQHSIFARRHYLFIQ